MVWNPNVHFVYMSGECVRREWGADFEFLWRPQLNFNFAIAWYVYIKYKIALGVQYLEVVMVDDITGNIYDIKINEIKQTPLNNYEIVFYVFNRVDRGADRLRKNNKL